MAIVITSVGGQVHIESGVAKGTEDKRDVTFTEFDSDSIFLKIKGVSLTGTTPIPIEDLDIDGETPEDMAELLTMWATVFLSAGGAAGTTLGIEIAATFAAITVSTTKRLVYVAADETNNDDISLYIHNGTELKFISTL